MFRKQHTVKNKVWEKILLSKAKIFYTSKNAWIPAFPEMTMEYRE